jgi:RHS repeat-associated protein
MKRGTFIFFIFCTGIFSLPLSAHATASTTTYFPFPTYSETNGVATLHIYLGNTLIATVNGSGASSTIQYDHADQLGSTNVVTNAAGKPSEFLEYAPYGAPQVNKQLTGIPETRTYINEYSDPATNLSYLNARYYDPQRGQFVSEDPLFWADSSSQNLETPQTLNSYTYANGNPVTKEDPSGLLTIIIPGTFYNPKDWSASGAEANFISSVGNTFNDSAHTEVINDPSIWSGADTAAAREKAADSIANGINNYSFAPGEPLNIVGHSHGGNVGILVSQMITHPISNLVTLATPVQNNYQPNYSIIQNHINVYSTHDPVQTIGGSATTLSQVVGAFVFGALGFVLGGAMHYDELGPAARTYPNATNINVSSQSGWGISAHSSALSNPAIWAKVTQFVQP